MIFSFNYSKSKSHLQGNILIKDDETPCLCDFGNVRARFGGASLSTTHIFNNRGRWSAPELAFPDSNTVRDEDGDAKATPASDIWSFGMTALELLTEKPPYLDFTDKRVQQALHRKEDPDVHNLMDSTTEARGLSKRMHRSILLKCWRKVPDQRPSARQLIDAFRQLRAT